MLRNLEKNVIFRAIITKKILPKSKNKTIYIKFYELFSCFPVQIFGRFKIMVPFPFTSQRYYQFSRFIPQYKKMHHIQSLYLKINQP